MTERLKTMGKIEYALGVVYGIIITAYTAGLPVSTDVILVAILFTAAYFGHWAFLLIDKYLDHRIVLMRLEDERRSAEIRHRFSLSARHDPRFLHDPPQQHRRARRQDGICHGDHPRPHHRAHDGPVLPLSLHPPGGIPSPGSGCWTPGL